MARPKGSANAPKTEKKVTRYTYEDIREPRTPETGHTSLLPAEEQVVTLPMDNGWSKAIQIGKLPEGDVSRDDQHGKRDNQDGRFFEGAFFEPFGSDLTRLEAI